MDRNEIDFLSAAVAMLEQACNVEETAKRMIRMIDHIKHSEICSREHKSNVSVKWLECALKNHSGKTVCSGQTIDEFIGSSCF